MALTVAERIRARGGPVVEFALKITEANLCDDRLLKNMDFNTARCQDFLSVVQVLMAMQSWPDRPTFTQQAMDKWVAQRKLTEKFKREADGLFTTYLAVSALFEHGDGPRISPVEFLVFALAIHANKGASIENLGALITRLRKHLRGAGAPMRVNKTILSMAYTFLLEQPEKPKRYYVWLGSLR